MGKKGGSSLSIAETVIVGEIPESFTRVYGDGAPLISKINDYRVW